MRPGTPTPTHNTGRIYLLQAIRQVPGTNGYTRFGNQRMSVLSVWHQIQRRPGRYSPGRYVRGTANTSGIPSTAETMAALPHDEGGKSGDVFSLHVHGHVNIYHVSWTQLRHGRKMLTFGHYYFKRSHIAVGIGSALMCFPEPFIISLLFRHANNPQYSPWGSIKQPRHLCGTMTSQKPTPW
ncbi:uncharacterized protein LOC143451748 isoform X1 [Clavelina lepadiformis]|uniref:uncharacterized protein LOC143451748 isoform X1 n=1 Tax=Clavelina lepadiformis TaxID=159417 RepID=UPI00404307FD